MSADVGRAVNLSGPSIANSAGEPVAAGVGDADDDAGDPDMQDASANRPAASATQFEDFNNDGEDIYLALRFGTVAPRECEALPF